MLIQQVETPLDSMEIFNLFKENQYAFFLDSGMAHGNLGQYSFIGWDPFVVFKSKGRFIEITKGQEMETLEGDPFKKIQELLNKYKLEYRTSLPFIGGAVGYFAYDLCHHIENLPRTAIDDVGIPDCYLGFYDGVVIIEHIAQKVWVAALGIKDTPINTVESIINIISNGTKEVNPSIKASEASKELPSVHFKSNFTKDEYLAAVRKVKDYIQEGDIYQANLTQRFRTTLNTTPVHLYQTLRKINPAPFAGFIDFGQGHVLSSSPERFIKIKGRDIETRPIKGTRPRGKTLAEDERNKIDLLNSEKDKAELLMIVDLERNDLGKICKTGTVRVPKLFELEEYSTVYHLVATVEGELKEGLDVVDALKATFPGGSITGAPKIRAMEIIDELEPTQRNIYTGSMGYIGFNGDADLNIVIRTIVCKDGEAFFQVGGGIVWDSQEELEYEETLHKGKALMKALKS